MSEKVGIARVVYGGEANAVTQAIEDMALADVDINCGSERLTDSVELIFEFGGDARFECEGEFAVCEFFDERDGR